MPKGGHVKTLKPVQTTEEAQEKGRAGGIKSGESKRRTKLFRELLATVLACGASESTIAQLRKMKKIPAGFTDAQIQELDQKMLIIMRIVDTTLTARDASDLLRGFQIIQEAIGEKPKDKVEHSGTVTVEQYLKGVKRDEY